MKKHILIGSLSLALLIMSLSGCKKIFDIKPKEVLDESQMYQNVYDADAAIIGIYGKFMSLSDRYIILNELRGDLLDVTDNANENLRQISSHSVTENNPYASPRPFYELILNCNDALEQFKKMLKENKMNETQYAHRYSDIGALRSFLYLQLGIHYGQVPYVTSPLKNVDDVKNSSNFTKLPFNSLLDSLVNFAENLPFKDNYPPGTNLYISVDGYTTLKFFIDKKILLGDLYLWKGDYVKAGSYYRQVMEFATVGDRGENYYSQYKIGWAGGFNHYISYARPGDATSLLYNDGWRTMFDGTLNDGYSREWIWVLPYDNKFKPENPLIKLFSPIEGDYLVKPSQQVVDLWNSQVQNPAQGASLLYDARKLLSVMDIGGKPVAMKFLYNYINYSTLLPVNPLVKNSKWFLFRQTHLHLRFSEAANRAGRYRLAWGLWNNGLAGAYPAPPPGLDVTLYHNTLSDAYPFNFDGRNSGGSGVPSFRADWYRNIGIRARANVTNVAIPATDSLLSIEAGLIQETALENAFEGTRWADLLRVTLRRNDPSFIADKIYYKLLKSDISSAQASQARAKLMARDWYLPFKW